MVSARNPEARPPPFDDLFYTRNVFGPVWSPDGQEIVFTTDLSGRFHLWTVRSAGAPPCSSCRAITIPAYPKKEAQRVVDILEKEGRTVDVHYYANEGHGFVKRENQIDSVRRTTASFDQYLLPPSKPHNPSDEEKEPRSFSEAHPEVGESFDFRRMSVLDCADWKLNVNRHRDGGASH